MNKYNEEEKILLSALALHQERYLDKLIERAENEKITFTSNFEHRMEKLIKNQKKAYYALINTVSKRVACIIVAILVSFAAMMSVDAIREPFLRYIINIFEDHSEVYFKEETQNNQEMHFETILPEYIPTDYTIHSQNVYPFYSFTEYINSYGDILSIQQGSVDDEHLLIDSENTEIHRVYVNGFEAMCYENKGENILIVADFQYHYIISGKIEKNELIKIAESLKLKN